MTRAQLTETPDADLAEARALVRRDPLEMVVVLMLEVRELRRRLDAIDTAIALIRACRAPTTTADESAREDHHHE